MQAATPFAFNASHVAFLFIFIAESLLAALHVAVYGTLRAGGNNDIQRLRAGLICTGKTCLEGTLYDLGWYPGLQLQGPHVVLAEVYALDAVLEQALDGIEGLWPTDLGEYAKRLLRVPVALPSGVVQPMTVLVYEALPATVQGAPVIHASDWLAWMEAKGRRHPKTAFQLRTKNNAAPSAG